MPEYNILGHTDIVPLIVFKFYNNALLACHYEVVPLQKFIEFRLADVLQMVQHALYFIK